MDKVGFLERKRPDGSVEKSSKRLFGAMALSSGGLLLLALGIVSLFTVAADALTVLEVGKILCGLGTVLLGVGVVEGVSIVRSEK